MSKFNGHLSGKPLVVATSLTWPPFGSLAVDGQPVGIDMSIAEHIAAALKMNLQINNGDFASVIEAMNTNGAHMGISSISITPERAQNMLFSIPYHTTGGLVLVTNLPVGESIFDGMTVEQVRANMPDVNVGTGGTAGTPALFVQDNGGIVNAVGTCTAINMLATEDTVPFNYVLLDNLVASHLTANFPNLRVVDTPLLTHQEIGIAFPLQRADLLPQINSILQKMEDDGTLDQIFARKFF